MVLEKLFGSGEAHSSGSFITLVLSLGAVAVVVSYVSAYWKLRYIPGPVAAGFTNVQRMSWAMTGKAHLIHRDLHKTYGPLVRFGPNMVVCNDPAEIPKIYPTKAGTVKSEFYHALVPYVNGKATPGLFQCRDETLHGNMKRPIANAYSLTNVKTFETYVDSTLNLLVKRLNELFAKTGEVCDYGLWLQMFAFDTMGEMTFSKKFGFLDKGGDIDGVMAKIYNFFKTAVPFTQIPWLDKYCVKNPFAAWIRGSTASPMMVFAAKQAVERQKTAEKGDSDNELNDRDFVSRFIEAKAKDPKAPDWAILMWTFSNITAGSDSTAAILRCLWFHLLTYPESFKKLQAELDGVAKQGKLSMPCKWDEVRELPYLDAVIKEALRMHTPFGLPFERIVAEGGVEVCGQFIPEGTILAMNPWVANRHPGTYGEDVDTWRPERWLCDEEQRKVMENGLMTFGAGRRVCLGKYIAYLEMYKAVATLMQAFDVDIVNPQGFEVENFWFMNSEGLMARLKAREGVEIAA